MTVVLKFHGFASNSSIGRKFIGHYVKSFDHEAHNGRGDMVFTPDICEALTFPTVREAMVFIRLVPACKPLRPDGKPNRPLTASHLEIVTLNPDPYIPIK